MPFPFGVAIGDFIAGINLLIAIVTSLHETHGARADYQELARELTSLRVGLDSVRDLSLDAAQVFQASAVSKSVDNCYSCVNGFLQRNSKFQDMATTSDQQRGLDRLKRRIRCVQWAILKKDDVAKLRAEVQQHCEAIQMLLATLHV